MHPTISRIYLKYNFSLEPSSLQHALCTLIITTLSYTYLYCQPTTQASWLLLSSILLSQAGITAELKWQALQKTSYYLFFGLFAALCVFLLSLNPVGFLMKVLLTTLVVFISNYLAWLNRRYYFAAFTVSLLSVLAAYLPCSLPSALERGYLIFIGGLLVFLVRFFFFLYQRSQALYYAKVIFFQKLKQVFKLIFYTAGPKRPLFSLELEESHFQIAWSDCLSALVALKGKVPAGYARSLDRLWDLTLSLSSLRYRLSDFSVLSMSQDEMRDLVSALLSILSELARAKPRTDFSARFDAYQNAIQRFEELYQSMLQAVAKEPLVLLLFIQDLYALKEELEKIVLNFYSKQGSSREKKSGGET